MYDTTNTKMLIDSTPINCALNDASVFVNGTANVPHIPANMFAGIWGTLAVPLTNTDASFSAQLIGVLSINIFVFVVSYIVFSIMKATFGIRLSKEAEAKGTDVTETGVIAYAIRD